MTFGYVPYFRRFCSCIYNEWIGKNLRTSHQ